ncbi:hypothetical protein O6H91_11G034400 [Diphasiastrum complanatum]|uniref:Uncharacterized protein n=1 Tax=Diphasiastrum complanatum TaxID=34168 RepID=A0ACC2C7T7_DIPCM|nr:hypothetical protein O6H91_11G034400 [Diphasiastrum complanatum]
MLERKHHRHAGIVAGVMCLVHLIQSAAGTFVGVNFGTDVSDLPEPEHVVDMLMSMGVGQVRLFDANPRILSAFAGSDIQVLVGIPNQLILSVGSSDMTASKWLQNNVLAFLPNTNITGIVVGNEVLTDYTIAATILLSTMWRIHNALAAVNLEKEIKVSSPHSSSLIIGAFPPSHASFNETYSTSVVQPLLDFLCATGSFFMLNINALALYQQSKPFMSLDYVLFRPNKGAQDKDLNLVYYNIFDAVVDAAFNAMAAMNHSELPIVVSEIGWPWMGNPSEVEASIENAGTFNGNLIKHVLNNTGTPRRPGMEINTYIYELFDEDKKVGLNSERYWGILSTNQTPIYRLDVSGSSIRDLTNGSSTPNQSWCVAKREVPDSQLSNALNWVCGQGNANCGPIQQNGPCFSPDSYQSHASFAFNTYYQKTAQVSGSCDFGGTAIITYSDPSYGSCSYSLSATSNMTYDPNGGNPNGSSSRATSNVYGSSYFAQLMSFLSVFLCVFLLEMK